MSYFMTTSGSTPQLHGVAPIALVRAGEAQQYIRNLANKLAAADGEPVYLVHDGTTGTSHDFIVAAGEHLQVHGSLLGTPFLSLLQSLVAAGDTFRIWWAANGVALPEGAQCHSIDALVAGIEEQFLAGRDLAIRYAPPEGRTPAAADIHKP